MKKLSHGQPEGPVTLRMSPELQEQLDHCATKTGMKTTDLMRLCMRIGIEHFRRIEYDTAKCIVEAAKNNPSQESGSLIKAHAWKTHLPAPTVASAKPSRASSQAPAIANTVPMPPQHVVGLNETTEAPPITEERVETTYPKPTRKRKA